MAPSSKEAMLAIKTLHDFYSQPGLQIPPTMMELLGKSFVDVIKNDPFKE